jgi:hypothetical protein
MCQNEGGQNQRFQGAAVMNTLDKRRTALANRLGVDENELKTPPDEENRVGARFELQPGGYYWVYSPDEERQAFKARVPDVPFLSQIQDDDGKMYNVYLAVERCRPA